MQPKRTPYHDSRDLSQEPSRHVNTIRWPWRGYINRLLAREISAFTRYYDLVVETMRPPHDDGVLFDLIDCPCKVLVGAHEATPDLSHERRRRVAILLNGSLNHSDDIQGILEALRARVSRTARVIAIVYNPYFAWLYRLANRLGLRDGVMPTSFVTFTDLLNIARLSGFRLVRTRRAVYCPFHLFGLGSIINALLPTVPLLHHLSFTSIVVMAPIAAEEEKPSVSVIIPAKNERGNIAAALRAMQAIRGDLPGLEVVFVEGHSSDGTWEEIERLAVEYTRDFKIQLLRQHGHGKADAVRLGIERATGDVVVILDADLTMPPAMLVRFYTAYRDGHGEFVNGSRLVYAVESGAMRFLNRLGNVLFAKFLSRVLSVRLGDSLCGTKLFSRSDYTRFAAWRRDFGDFDPFGDFELLFPAAILGLTVVDLPIVYRARQYGETNISRFAHGWMLAKMTAIGFWRVRLGQVQ